ERVRLPARACRRVCRGADRGVRGGGGRRPALPAAGAHRGGPVTGGAGPVPRAAGEPGRVAALLGRPRPGDARHPRGGTGPRTGPGGRLDPLTRGALWISWPGGGLDLLTRGALPGAPPGQAARPVSSLRAVSSLRRGGPRSPR